MTKMKIAIIFILWIGFGIIGAGFDNAYFQRKWPDQCDGRRDHAKSMMLVVAGPINAIMSFLSSGYGQYGWSLSLIANPYCEKK